VPTRLAARLALALVCVAAAVASAIAYVSVKRVDRAAHAFIATGNVARVLHDLRASDSPLNPSNYRDQGIAIALLHLGRPVAAERFVARVVREHPQNENAWVTLTRVQIARGRLAAARRSWERVRRLDPHRPAALPGPV
jgi:predicted Zn-dependent protease